MRTVEFSPFFQVLYVFGTFNELRQYFSKMPIENETNSIIIKVPETNAIFYSIYFDEETPACTLAGNVCILCDHVLHENGVPLGIENSKIRSVMVDRLIEQLIGHEPVNLP